MKLGKSLGSSYITAEILKAIKRNQLIADLINAIVKEQKVSE